jgi:hypothetical protein
MNRFFEPVFYFLVSLVFIIATVFLAISFVVIVGDEAGNHLRECKDPWVKAKRPVSCYFVEAKGEA